MRHDFQPDHFRSTAVSSAHDDSQASVLSPRNATVLIGLLLVAVFTGEVLLAPAGEDSAVAAQPTEEQMAAMLKPVITLEEMRSNMTVAAAGGAVDLPPDQLYQNACLACHSTGAAGAPKIGDAAAWAERLGKGVDALVTSAINGIGAMPPRGGSQFTDDQIRSVVEYILDNSR